MRQGAEAEGPDPQSPFQLIQGVGNKEGKEGLVCFGARDFDLGV